MDKDIAPVDPKVDKNLPWVIDPTHYGDWISTHRPDPRPVWPFLTKHAPRFLNGLVALDPRGLHLSFNTTSCLLPEDDIGLTAAEKAEKETRKESEREERAQQQRLAKLEAAGIVMSGINVGAKEASNSQS